MRERVDLLGGWSDVAHRLANLDELTLLDVKDKVLGRLKDEDNRAPELEPAHLVARVQRLAAQEGRRLLVASLDVRAGRVRADSVVGPQGLWMQKEGEGQTLARTGGENQERTLSKLTTMLPTLVAPTGTMLKKPCFHRPRTAEGTTTGLSVAFDLKGGTKLRSTYARLARSRRRDPRVVEQCRARQRRALPQSAVASRRPRPPDCGTGGSLQERGR